jgi:predicted ATP-dependent serine protease
LPVGKLSVLDGDPGLGKSTLLIDIAARVTTHGMHFNGKCQRTGNNTR